MNKIIKPFIELERYSYSSYKDIIPIDLFLDGLCTREHQEIFFTFSGIVITDHGMIVVFPKGYTIPNEKDELKKHTVNLLETLIRYRQTKNIDEYEKELLGGIGNNKSISSLFWILKDYFDYGLINIQETKYRINSNGSINWNRTIKQLNPVISNQQPVYLDFVNKYNNTNYNDLTYKIHKYAVHQSLNTFGWLLGVDYEDTDSQLFINKELAIYHLENMRQQTFVDREIELYQNLIEFLEGSSSNQETKDKVITFLTPHFHTVWEEICDFIFDGQIDYDEMIPRPFWSKDHQIWYTQQIPDIIFVENQLLYILDAKYYRINYKLPGWGDLIKQFFYAKTLDIPYNIKNIMIFPSSSPNTIEYLGFAEIERNKDFGRVNGYIIDIYKAMRSYVRKDKGEFRQKLIYFENLKDQN